MFFTKVENELNSVQTKLSFGTKLGPIDIRFSTLKNQLTTETETLLTDVKGSIVFDETNYKNLEVIFKSSGKSVYICILHKICISLFLSTNITVIIQNHLFEIKAPEGFTISLKFVL